MPLLVPENKVVLGPTWALACLLGSVPHTRLRLSGTLDHGYSVTKSSCPLDPSLSPS